MKIAYIKKTLYATPSRSFPPRETWRFRQRNCRDGQFAGKYEFAERIKTNGIFYDMRMSVMSQRF